MSQEHQFGWQTPTYTSLLNKQLDRVLTALSDGDPIQTFVELRSLIIVLPPEISDKLVEDDVNHINDRIGAVDPSNVDAVLVKAYSNSATRNILAEENLPLFQKIIRAMHENRLLVKYTLKPKENPRLWGEEEEATQSPGSLQESP